MITWFMFKEVLWEICIKDMIFNGDILEQSLGIVWLPFIFAMSFLGMLLDIISIPLYLLIGLVYLILKVLERMKWKWYRILILTNGIERK